VIELVNWKKDVSPSMGRPQDIISTQIGSIDIFIGIMWKRFGTPTGKAESGVQEEFETAYESWKMYNKPRIMFYFSQLPYVIQTDTEVQQIRKVIEFRREISRCGLYYEYKDIDEFENAARQHLTNILFEIAAPKKSKDIILIAATIECPINTRITSYKFLCETIPQITTALKLRIDPKDVLDKVMSREKIMSTGTGGGVAMPHTYGSSLAENLVVILASKMPIDWNSLDGKPVNIVFLSLFAESRAGTSVIIHSTLGYFGNRLKNEVDRIALHSDAALRKLMDSIAKKFVSRGLNVHKKEILRIVLHGM
jgi:mannitol/fructose-specific phosphotransferase system IIA component (Ntr-type)